MLISSYWVANVFVPQYHNYWLTGRVLTGIACRGRISLLVVSAILSVAMKTLWAYCPSSDRAHIWRKTSYKSHRIFEYTLCAYVWCVYVKGIMAMPCLSGCVVETRVPHVGLAIQQ